jgi:hypothetical protein
MTDALPSWTEGRVRVFCLVCVQMCSPESVSVPFRLLKGAGLRNSGPCPSAKFECCARQHRTSRPLGPTYSGRSVRVAARPERPSHSAPRVQPSAVIVTNRCHGYSWQAIDTRPLVVCVPANLCIGVRARVRDGLRVPILVCGRPAAHGRPGPARCSGG